MSSTRPLDEKEMLITAVAVKPNPTVRGIGHTSFIHWALEEKALPSSLLSISYSSHGKERTFDDIKISPQISKKVKLNFPESPNPAASIFYILYDKTNKKSFEDAEQYLNTNSKKLRNSTYYLIGTKSDLVGDEIISTDQGKKLAIQFNVTFFECSGKTGENIDHIIRSSLQNELLRRKPTAEWEKLHTEELKTQAAAKKDESELALFNKELAEAQKTILTKERISKKDLLNASALLSSAEQRIAKMPASLSNTPEGKQCQPRYEQLHRAYLERCENLFEEKELPDEVYYDWVLKSKLPAEKLQCHNPNDRNSIKQFKNYILLREKQAKSFPKKSKVLASDLQKSALSSLEEEAIFKPLKDKIAEIAKSVDKHAETLNNLNDKEKLKTIAFGLKDLRGWLIEPRLSDSEKTLDSRIEILLKKIQDKINAIDQASEKQKIPPTSVTKVSVFTEKKVEPPKPEPSDEQVEIALLTAQLDNIQKGLNLEKDQPGAELKIQSGYTAKEILESVEYLQNYFATFKKKYPAKTSTLSAEEQIQRRNLEDNIDGILGIKEELQKLQKKGPSQ